jgi:hypothetical protein
MKMYIPEIGDHIKLTEDWTFTLYAESRNVKLAKFYGYDIFYFNGYNWIPENNGLKEPEKNYKIIYPDENDFKDWLGKRNYNDYFQARKKAELENKEYQQYLIDSEKYRNDMKTKSVDGITVTLPKGTILSIDRLYIRKGSSDYSSITFYAKNLGEVVIKSMYSKKTTKIKSPRFWAKLSECNNIEFESTEKIK